jgi:hypothetical protein
VDPVAARLGADSVAISSALGATAPSSWQRLRWPDPAVGDGWADPGGPVRMLLPVSSCGDGGPWMGSLGLSTGFFVFYLIYRDGRPTASVKAGFTVTFAWRRMGCPPRLIVFARLV